MTTPYVFDPQGTLESNKITGEQHIITGVSHRDYHFIVPTYAPFFREGCVVIHKDIDNNIRTLVEGLDFYFGFQFIAASRSCAKPIYGGISFLNLELSGLITIEYQTVGGDWTIDPILINEILSNVAVNPRVISWEQVAAVPTLFPVVDHEWNLQDLVGMSEVVDSITGVIDVISTIPEPEPLVFVGTIATKETVGLGNVQNFGISTDQEAIDGASTTKYMTPRASYLAIQHAMGSIDVGDLVGPVGPTGPTGDASTIPGPTGPTGPMGNIGPIGIGIPKFGTNGQALVKKSEIDYDTEWSNVVTPEVLSQALLALYKVGTVYMNVTDSTDPSILFGFGVWVPLGFGGLVIGQTVTEPVHVWKRIS
jgi:hypothetical protein